MTLVSNLPAPPPEFIARELVEEQSLSEALAKSRRVMLVGHLGVGKTTLACNTIHQTITESAAAALPASPTSMRSVAWMIRRDSMAADLESLVQALPHSTTINFRLLADIVKNNNNSSMDLQQQRHDSSTATVQEVQQPQAWPAQSSPSGAVMDGDVYFILDGFRACDAVFLQYWSASVGRMHVVVTCRELIPLDGFDVIRVGAVSFAEATRLAFFLAPEVKEPALADLLDQFDGNMLAVSTALQWLAAQGPELIQTSLTADVTSYLLHDGSQFKHVVSQAKVAVIQAQPAHARRLLQILSLVPGVFVPLSVLQRIDSALFAVADDELHDAINESAAVGLIRHAQIPDHRLHMSVAIAAIVRASVSQQELTALYEDWVQAIRLELASTAETDPIMRAYAIKLTLPLTWSMHTLWLKCDIVDKSSTDDCLRHAEFLAFAGGHAQNVSFFALAADCVSAALDIRGRFLGTTHSLVAQLHTLRAQTLISVGRMDAAKTACETAISCYDALQYDGDHPEVTRALLNKGIACYFMTQLDTAQNIFEDVIERRRRHHGTDKHALVAETQQHLARTIFKKRDYAVAHVMMNAVENTVAELHGKQSLAYASALNMVSNTTILAFFVVCA